jgi:hypothetical protein
LLCYISGFSQRTMYSITLSRPAPCIINRNNSGTHNELPSSISTTTDCLTSISEKQKNTGLYFLYLLLSACILACNTVTPLNDLNINHFKTMPMEKNNVTSSKNVDF